MPIKTVLFVDDDVTMLRTWRRRHGRARVVLTAETSLQALELVRDHEIDLAIVDQRLLGERGIDVIDKLRAVSDARFVLTSAELNEHDHLNAFERDIPVFPKQQDWQHFIAVLESRLARPHQSYDASLDVVNAELIERMLQRHECNISRTARVLGLSRNGLKRKLVKLDIKPRSSR